MKYVCETCEHRDQAVDGGEYRCANRDSDLWGMVVGPQDTCLDWELAREDYPDKLVRTR